MLGNFVQRWGETLFFRIGGDEVVDLFLFLGNHGFDFQTSFKYNYIVLETDFSIKSSYPQLKPNKMHDKKSLFDLAVEISKEYARGGSGTTPSHIFEMTYAMLKKTAQEENILSD